MKKLLLAGIVQAVIVTVLLWMSKPSEKVRAAPENPNAPVDLVNVESVYGAIGVPGDPGQNISAWVEVKAIQPGPHTIYLGVFDHQEFRWVTTKTATFATTIFYWFPQWQFKSDPDSYEVYLYWSAGGWVFADKAIGWIQADVEVQCDPGHCPFSPNEYTYPFISNVGSDYKQVKQYFWYFDNSYYGDMEGTDRLNRLRQYTNNPLPIGKLQIEYRRADATGGNAEGWDAGWELWAGPLCQFVPYGTDTNLPSFGLAHEELTGACYTGRDEEAEVWTQDDLQVYAGQDPTGVYNSGNPKVYYVGIKFRRLPNYKGQPFILRTEFEMVDGIPVDTTLDVILSTKYIHETF